MWRWRRTLVCLAASLFAGGALPTFAATSGHSGADTAAGTGKTPDWSVERPAADTQAIPIDVSEGTWMSLDVSPDGRTIAFDLLGDIYTLPIAGGTATAISSGMAWEMQPRFSPDGKSLAYISDRGGADNIWLHRLDGAPEEDARRALTDEQFRLLNNPSFSPDGRFIVARKHFTTGRSLGTGELWLYHIAGGGGQQLLARKDKKHQKELGEPVFAPDGRTIYFSKDTTPGPIFQYAQDSNGQVFQILKLDMATGEVQPVVSGAGGAARPTPSPDGTQLAFVRRSEGQTGLWLKDLKTGAERQLIAGLDQDLQEVWAVHGVYPNMAWLPDSSALLYWAGGGLRRVNVANAEVQTIPFRVNDSRRIVPVHRPSVPVFEELVRTRMARGPVLSPDGKRIVFEALGRLYVKELPNGKPRRLTTDRERRFEFQPAFAADSRRVVFATWDDEALGSVRTVSARGGRSKAWSTQPGHYVEPGFAASGDAVVVRNAGRHSQRQPRYAAAGIYWIDQQGNQRLLSRTGRLPHVIAHPVQPGSTESAQRVYFSARSGDRTLLRSVDTTGGRPRIHAAADFVTEFVLAPSRRWLAYRENFNVYAIPYSGFATAAEQAEEVWTIGRKKAGYPNHRVSVSGGNYPRFAGDTLSYSLGNRFFWVAADELDQATESPAESAAEEGAAAAISDHGVLNVESTSLQVSAAADAPSGRLLLRNARIITMGPAGVIEQGDLLVEGNRIVALDDSLDNVPGGTPQLDLSGKTIVPGFIDAHAHINQGRTIVPEQNWQNHATLALGVTTAHDPSNDATSFFTAAELQRTGRILAPRLFSTGDVVYGARSTGLAAIENADDALDHVRRLKAQGAMSIKNYNQPRRNQRQQVVAAAQRENLLVVAEGGSLFHMDLAMVADGNSTIEHNLPQSMLYEDVLQFWSQTDVAYTPTLVVTYGGLTAEHYWYQEDDVWRHPILSQHVPPDVLRPRSIRRQKAPLTDYHHIHSARTAALLADRGVLVSIGAHGQREGLASHWEMWGFAQGGMKPLEVLATATIAPAKALGFAAEIGSLEVGKLADLVVLTENPLDDIYLTDHVDKVMLNGRLYDAATLREEQTGNYAPKRWYWQEPADAP